jgi:integrase
MPKLEFTEAAVAQLAPPAKGKQIDYLDTVIRGLVLRVNYGGAKIWRASYRERAKTGKSITIQTAWKLGIWPSMSVQAAREAALLFRADPHKAKAQKARAAGGASFEEVWQSFKKRHVDANHLRSGREITRCMTKYILPVLGPKRFRDLTLADDITPLNDHIEDEHGPAQARRCLAHIRNVMNWYAERNDYTCPIKPNRRKRGTGPDNGEARKRTLDDAELRALWSVCTGMGAFGAFCQTLLLTAQRRDKVLTMKWPDVVNGCWKIDTKPGEKGNGKELVLPKLVREIINAQRQGQIAGDERVFATVWPLYRNKRDLDDRLAKVLRRPVEPFVLHDLRRSARSLMSRAGVLPHVAEKVLGHSLKGMEKVYDQYDWKPEKAKALDKLARLVAGIVGQEAAGKPAGAIRRRAGRR